MTIEELEAQRPSDTGDDAITCELVEDEDAEKEHLIKIKACAEQIMRILFGKNRKLAGKDRVEKIIAKIFTLQDTEAVEEDLGEGLDLLESSLFLMEKMLRQYPHLMGVDLINQMEEIQDFLTQWGMG